MIAAAGALIGAVVGGTLAGEYGVVNLLTVQGAGYVVAGLAAGALLRRREVRVTPKVEEPETYAAEVPSRP